MWRVQRIRKCPHRAATPTVTLKRSTYQPSKAELEEPIHVDATPEELARAVVRPVNVVYED